MFANQSPEPSTATVSPVVTDFDAPLDSYHQALLAYQEKMLNGDSSDTDASDVEDVKKKGSSIDKTGKKKTLKSIVSSAAVPIPLVVMGATCLGGLGVYNSSCLLGNKFNGSTNGGTVPASTTNTITKANGPDPAPNAFNGCSTICNKPDDICYYQDFLNGKGNLLRSCAEAEVLGGLSVCGDDKKYLPSGTECKFYGRVYTLGDYFSENIPKCSEEKCFTETGLMCLDENKEKTTCEFLYGGLGGYKYIPVCDDHCDYTSDQICLHPRGGETVTCKAYMDHPNLILPSSSSSSSTTSENLESEKKNITKTTSTAPAPTQLKES